jgi:deoxyadenosine/deoxycytidine kinase
MKPKIIMIEGNPGSGKTTFSRRLKETLVNNNYNVESFQEGELHPIDLAWIARLDEKTYLKTLEAYPMLKEDIIKHTKKVDDLYLVAYTRVDYNVAPKAFYEEMGSYEIFKEKTLEPFFKAYQSLYQAFSKSIKDDTIYIFECVYIQNHINELLLKHNLEKEAIFSYFKTLIEPIKAFEPLILFINQANVKASIDRIASERLSPDKSKFPDWIERVIDYIKSMPYGESKGYKDYDSIITYFEHRQTLTNDLLKALPVHHHTVQLHQDYDHVFEALKNHTLNYINKK